MTTSITPETIERRRQKLVDYFTTVTDISRGDLEGCDCACSMEHVSAALDDTLDEWTVYPDLSGASQAMACILVAFNDATDVNVLRSDAWRLELLPRYAEATDTLAADAKRLELLKAWLVERGDAHTSDLTIAIDYCTLYGRLERLFTAKDKSLPSGAGLTVEEYLAFLHTLINP